ncbi:NAD-dependent malic enzyme 62 kDa isoform, mitochondrial-like [Cucumis sativus]|uniref:NAD-dependent malic enzyme 62 kDa isoform, mitochondrial-like n=1 Tax=Cucumis sativus TaxID=3659 RepID=UPI0012F49DCF|nr:NAD-dependent malic enzyme 62 kDa isoform, mitochondrial-like [Cucumis sativus]
MILFDLLELRSPTIFMFCLFLHHFFKAVQLEFHLQVDMIVLTDGSRILGLGDLGVQGIGIPRLEGEEYLSIVDDFMEAVHTCWPKAIVQFEDFQMKWAFETLQRYRKRFCMFNDDIQGTAGVALVGLLGTVRAQGRPLSDFVNQKIVVVGAGSAGLGVLNMTIQAVSRMAGNNDSSLLYQKQRRKGRDHKKSMVESIRQGVENYNSVFVFTVENMRNLKFKELREQLKSASRVVPVHQDPRELEGLNEGANLLKVIFVGWREVFELPSEGVGLQFLASFFMELL